MGPLYQDLYGSAASAIDGDELDIALPAIPEEPERIDAEAAPSADSRGLNLLQKVSLFGIIIGAAALFLRTRKGLIVRERSLA